MTELYKAGFPCPQPIDYSRHCIVMQYLDATSLYQIRQIENFVKCDTVVESKISCSMVEDTDNPLIQQLYDQLIHLILKFAKHGLIHGDFNEFNLMLENCDESSQRKVGEYIEQDENGDNKSYIRENVCPKIYVIDFPQVKFCCYYFIKLFIYLILSFKSF